MNVKRFFLYFRASEIQDFCLFSHFSKSSNKCFFSQFEAENSSEKYSGISTKCFFCVLSKLYLNLREYSVEICHQKFKNGSKTRKFFKLKPRSFTVLSFLHFQTLTKISFDFIRYQLKNIKKNCIKNFTSYNKLEWLKFYEATLLLSNNFFHFFILNSTLNLKINCDRT